MKPHPWPDDDLAYVRQLAAEGETALAISHALAIRLKRDVTRNMVIGICRRRGISLGGNTYKNLPRTTHIDLVKSAKKPSEPKKRTARFVFGKLLAAPMPEPEPAIEDAPIVPDTMPVNTAIMDLARDACRYPLGDPRAEDFRFCGDPKRPGSSYCAGHHALCYVPRSNNATKRTLFRELV